MYYELILCAMQYIYRILFITVVVILFCTCGNKEKKAIVTPWGEVVGDSRCTSSNFSIDEIINNGEMIILTISGPDTYFDYHGKGMGTQYLLCEKFAQSIGVSLRAEVCRDTAEMVKRLNNGEADMIVLSNAGMLKGQKELCKCVKNEGVGWIVTKKNEALAETVSKWFLPSYISQVKNEEKWMFSTHSVSRHVYSPILNRSGGVISKYDILFRRYAPIARLDWKLLAAQCYQESCFDPCARSWAGARGLMQIMPSTADHLGLAHSDLENPEKNIEAAVRLHAELLEKFRDVRSMNDRQCFVLASYNGGAYHVRDAMALTKKNGGNPQSWNHVAPYILKLQQPKYYNDPIVKYGYMRGSETVEYVERIRQRYAQYRGIRLTTKVIKNNDFNSSNAEQSPGLMVPRRATKKYRYHI